MGDQDQPNPAGPHCPGGAGAFAGCLLCTHLQGQQEQEGLDAVKASIHEISHEEVVGGGAVTAHLKELHEIVELAMDVTA